jgi:hypothetical protein
MTETQVITPDLVSVRGYRSEPYPLSSSSMVESVVGLKQPIPVKVRPQPPFDPDELAEPVWLSPVLNRLREIIALPAGWDSYDARPIRRESIEGTLKALVAVMSEEAELPWIVPLPSGGIQLEWHRTSSDIEITLDGNDSMISIDDDEIPAGIGRWPAALTEIQRSLAAG